MAQPLCGTRGNEQSPWLVLPEDLRVSHEGSSVCSFSPHVILMRQLFYWPYVTEEKSEAQTGEVTWTGSGR